jgi:hypothetical protein
VSFRPPWLLLVVVSSPTSLRQRFGFFPFPLLVFSVVFQSDCRLVPVMIFQCAKNAGAYQGSSLFVLWFLQFFRLFVLLPHLPRTRLFDLFLLQIQSTEDVNSKCVICTIPSILEVILHNTKRQRSRSKLTRCSLVFQVFAFSG